LSARRVEQRRGPQHAIVGLIRLADATEADSAEERQLHVGAVAANQHRARVRALLQRFCTADERDLAELVMIERIVRKEVKVSGRPMRKP
jgi:hypothetical protein